MPLPPFHLFKTNRAALRADFADSAIRRKLMGKKLFFAAVLLVSAAAAFLFRSPAKAILQEMPALPLFGILLGVFLLGFGLFYNPSLLRISAWVFPVLLLLGIGLNLGLARQQSEPVNADLRRIPEDDSFALGQEYSYTLSVYHILATHYAGSQVIANSALLEEWELTSAELKEWAQIETNLKDYNSELTAEEEEILQARTPPIVKINTTRGYVTYFFFSLPSSHPYPLVFLSRDRNRYILPVKTYQRVFPNREALP